MKQHSFIVRFVIIFVPLLLFLALMSLAGITKNVFMTLILSLAFTWMIQAIYKKIMRKRNSSDGGDK